jgi:hypothetical protein
VFTARYGLYLCVLCGSQNKQRLFPHTALSYWFFYNRDAVWLALFWDITHRRMVILYRRFGITCRSHFQGSRSLKSRIVHLYGKATFRHVQRFERLLSFSSWISWPLKMGPKRCPEMSVKDYHSTLRNTPEEGRSHQYRCRSLKSRRWSVFTARYVL